MASVREGPVKHHWMVWFTVACFAALITFTTIVSITYVGGRAYDSCVSRRNLYDGQLVMVHFLAGQFHATPAQERAGTAVLVRTLGPRPVC